METDPDDPVVIGRLVRAHGIRGRLLLAGDPEELEMLVGLVRTYLRHPDRVEQVALTAVRAHRAGLVVRVTGVEDLSGAEALLGATIEVSRRDLPLPRLDRLIWPQIEGFEVVTEAGERLGELAERIRTGANDVYVVRDGEREMLIPASPNVLRRLEVSERRLVIHLLPGLLDIGGTTGGNAHA